MNRMNFSYILNDAHDPRYNLALEEVLFEEAVKTREGFLMLWSNDPPASSNINGAVGV